MNETGNGKWLMGEKLNYLVPCLLLVTVFVLLFATPSCNKSDTLNLDFHYDYVPADSGHYVIYDVDSIKYRYDELADTVDIDTIRYQQMEVVGDTVNFNNETWHELNLYRRPDVNSPWAFNRKWKIKKTITAYHKDEGDLWFIKFIFPPSDGGEWNGNIYLPTTQDYKIFQDWDYHYETLHEPFTVNNLNFDSTITVVEVNDSTAIGKVLRKEVYANDVGMIYQEWESLTFAVTPNPNWQTGKINGWRIRMRVNSYGP